MQLKDRIAIITGASRGLGKAIAVGFSKEGEPKEPVDTEGMRFWTREEDRKGWVSPEKMVKCAIFLAAQDASGVTGTVATDEGEALECAH